MISELWKSFPALLEQKINALLDGAEPKPAKAFQLYKACVRENLWRDSFERFSSHLSHFFSLSTHERHKSDLDAFLERPMDAPTFADFQLNFRNAIVDSRALRSLVDWTHNMMRVGHRTDCIVISTDVLSRTLHYITDPPPYEKVRDIEFEDFCTAWKKTVFRLFGKKYDPEMNQLMGELRRLRREQELQKKIDSTEERFVPGIYLTQTEIDWTLAVQKSVREQSSPPDFPLSRGPQKQKLIELQKALRLYKIVQTTKLPELLRHRDNIRSTILDQCAWLIREKAR